MRTESDGTDSSASPCSPCVGYFGSCKGVPMSKEAIALLKTGDKVEVVWQGGNGPYIYDVRNDFDPFQLNRTPRARSTEQLLKHAQFVALAND